MSSPAAWLAARRLAHHPARFARPAVAIGVLLFVLICWSGTYLNAVTGDRDKETSPEALTYYSVTWRDSTPGDLTYAALRT